eukprot:PITA_10789
MTMKKGEIAIVTIFPEYGYKDTQTQRDLAVVPPHSTLIYEIELISFIKAAKCIEYDNAFSEDRKQQTKALKITCNLNNPACNLKLKEYREAAKLCSKVLEVDSKNVKALYRRAQAYIETADLDQAESDLKKALEIDPSNRDVKIEYKTLKEKQKEYNKEEAKLFGNMFNRMSRLEE